MKKTTSLAVLILINVALTFVGMESLSLAAYWLRYDRLFYADAERHPRMTVGLHQDGENAVPTGTDPFERLHPFFGYVLRPHAFAHAEKFGLVVNNYGFFAQVDYPYQQNGAHADFVIGVFGGSVAADTATFGVRNHAFGIDGLVSALGRIDALSGKTIRVLNFASGGYKQPQQLLILSYFLSLGQHFDAVLNIDGFNEVALSNTNITAGHHVSMPSAQHIAPLVGLAARDTMLELAAVRLGLARERLNARIDTMNGSWLASAYTIREILLRQPAREFHAAIDHYEETQRTAPERDKTSMLFNLPAQDAFAMREEALRAVRDQWVRSSLLTHRLCQDAGAIYVHVLQPNQYHPMDRVFTEVEKRDYLSPEQVYAPGVKLGYPLLLEAKDRLRSQGVAFFDATPVFDQEPDTVYRDACCHYSELGQRRFETFIAQALAESLSSNAGKQAQRP